MKRIIFILPVVFLLACAAEKKEAVPVSSAGSESETIGSKDPNFLWQKATEFYDQGNYAECFPYLQRFVSLFPKEERYAEAQKRLHEVQLREGIGIFSVGALLPLGGDSARFGEGSLDGMACAFGIFDPCVTEMENVRLVLADSPEDPAQTQSAVQNLSDKKVALILGPLLSKTAPAAIDAAESKQVPMIVLAPVSNAAKGKQWVLQHSLLPETEVQGVVEYAVAKKKLKNFLVLYPENSYGQKYFSLFQEQVAGKEGVQVDALSYPADTLDFVNLLRSLKLKEKHVQAYGAGSRPTYDGIFIPDSYRQVRLIASALHFVGIRGGLLLGTMRWNHPHLVAESEEGDEQPLEGAVFVAGFDPTPLSNYQAAFGSAPGWLETYGFEAAQMALAAVKNRRSDYRPGILSSLLHLYSWDDNRLSKKTVPLLTVHESQIVPLTDEGI